MNQRSGYLYPFAFGAGIMLSPETLALAGNFFGRTGFPGILLVGCAALVFHLIAGQVATISVPAWILLIPKLFTALFLSTGILVSAGFVFNEVFVYWFPNFGFAFGLLALPVLIQFLPVPVIRGTQIGFSGIAAAGLAVLIIAGVLNGMEGEPGVTNQAPGFHLGAAFFPLLLFMGFDMGIERPSIHRQGPAPAISPLIWGMALAFTLWGVTALLHVPQEKLAQSAISYMRVARAVMGDIGRMVMGAVVIAGTLAAVQALFFAIRKDISDLFPEPGRPFGRPWPLLVLGTAVSGCMAGGLAGEDILETLIFGSFVLWLFSYLIVMILGIYRIHTRQSQQPKTERTTNPITDLAGAVVLAAGIAAFITIFLTKEIP